MREIRSFRKVFDLERRVYSVDRLRLNPAGVPVRGILYFLALLAASLACAAAPLAGAPIRIVPWYLRDLALPGIAATVLASLRVEGRPFHVAAEALVRHRLAPRLLVGLTRGEGERLWRPPELVVLPDGSGAQLRRMRYRGPGRALVAVEHERRGGPATGGDLHVATGTVSVTEIAGARRLPRQRTIVLGDGARLLVYGRRRRRLRRW